MMLRRLRRRPATKDSRGAQFAQTRKPATFLLGVGAQKAGTTWLHRYLAGSPQCARGYRKEYHVLDSAHLAGERWLQRSLDLAQAELDRLRRGEDADPALLHRVSMIASDQFYVDYFTGLLRSAPRIRLAADITPEYALLPPEPLIAIRDKFARRKTRVAALFLMRDPVDRIWSQLRMQEGRRPRRFPEPADKMLEQLYSEPLYEKWSHYEHTIRTLDAVLPEDDIYYGFFEELFDESRIREICDFVGIDFRTPDFERTANASAAKAVPELHDDLVATIATHMRDTYEVVAERFPDKDLKRLWPSSRFVL